MQNNNFNYFYVTTKRTKNSTKKLECYGSHATLKGAQLDQKDRLYMYDQKTSVVGVTGNGTVIFIQ